MNSAGRLSRVAYGHHSGPLSHCFSATRTHSAQAWEQDGTEADLRPGNLPILPSPGKNVDINMATFVKSTMEMKWLPPADKPEFAFIGHSNVGKSSLINLLSRLDMARVSNKPGGLWCNTSGSAKHIPAHIETCNTCLLHLHVSQPPSSFKRYVQICLIMYAVKEARSILRGRYTGPGLSMVL